MNDATERLAYVVYQGEYSDRQNRAVFLTEEAAKAWIGDRTYLDIEEVPLEPGPLYVHPTGYSGWRVDMWIDGSLRGTWVWAELGSPSYEIYNLDYGMPEERRGLVLIVCVFARDREHAIKIVNEKRTQLIAMNEWTPGRKRFEP